MTIGRLRKLRRRRLIVWDRRGLPARHVSVKRAGRHFGLLLYWVRQNGICVITEGGKPAAVIVSPDNTELIDLIYATVGVAAARRRDPSGVFTFADKVFGTCDRADRWMASEIWSLGGRRPVDLLGTEEGVSEVLNLLGCIEHGLFA